jgi:hypothetical protein
VDLFWAPLCSPVQYATIKASSSFNRDDWENNPKIHNEVFSPKYSSSTTKDVYPKQQELIVVVVCRHCLVPWFLPV